MISPQCGSDGRTYSNTCMLNCAKQRYCWSLKMVLLSKIWRCAEMTRGLTARAGPCSTNPLLNAVKQAGKKSIILFKRNLLGQVNFSEKNLANGNPRNPGDQLIPAEKLEEKCFNCRCTRIKDPQVELGLFCFSGDHWSLVKDQRPLARWNLAFFASLGIIDSCSRIKDS